MSWNVSIPPCRPEEVETALDDALNHAENFQYNPGGQKTARNAERLLLDVMAHLEKGDDIRIGLSMSGHTEPSGATSLTLCAWTSRVYPTETSSPG